MNMCPPNYRASYGPVENFFTVRRSRPIDVGNFTVDCLIFIGVEEFEPPKDFTRGSAPAAVTTLANPETLYVAKKKTFIHS